MAVGRKRSFCKMDALDKAMRLFWENGYSGTSLGDITSELGLHKPSLYAAFGNKEQLFTSTLEHYRSVYAAPNLKHLSTNLSSPLEHRLLGYIYGLIKLFTDKQTPLGCFFLKSSCEGDSCVFPVELTTKLKQMAVEDKTFLASFFQQEKAYGRLAKDANEDEIAEYLLTLIYGLAVQAIAGKTPLILQNSAQRALLAIPLTDSSNKND